MDRQRTIFGLHLGYSWRMSPCLYSQQCRTYGSSLHDGIQHIFRGIQYCLLRRLLQSMFSLAIWMAKSTGNLLIRSEVYIWAFKRVSASTMIIFWERSPLSLILYHPVWWNYCGWLSKESRIWAGHPFTRCVLVVQSRLWLQNIPTSVKLSCSLLGVNND